MILKSIITVTSFIKQQNPNIWSRKVAYSIIEEEYTHVFRKVPVPKTVTISQFLQDPVI